MNIIDLHETAWKQLGARRAQLPYALLISGQRGIGKFDFARAFAGSLLCENLQVNDRACGRCAACNWLAQGNHPDFRLLQPEVLAEEWANDSGEPADAGSKKKPSQQITIDQVRALDDFLHIGTHRHGARIILINPAEAMNRATANSLLKSLEEPTENTLFLLVSSEPDRLLPTIRSRCQAFPLAKPEAARAEAWLQQAGIADAGRWLALAGGSPLLAADLGSGDQRALLDVLLAQLARGGDIDPLAAAAALDRVIKAEKRPGALKRMIEWSQKWIVDLTLASQGLPLRYFSAPAQPVQSLAAALDTAKLLTLSRKTLQYRMQCEQPLNSRLFLEDFFLAYVAVFRVSRD
ncbi:MAG: DNA polymerase III subunit delta' [Propionivibrio sp.]